jgi:hypothetical protein
VVAHRRGRIAVAELDHAQEEAGAGVGEVVRQDRLALAGGLGQPAGVEQLQRMAERRLAAGLDGLRALHRATVSLGYRKLASDRRWMLDSVR